jgi:hypothetical protein
MEPHSSGRSLFDIFSSKLTRGPPTGIVGVEREFAIWAYAQVRNAVFAFF